MVAIRPIVRRGRHFWTQWRDFRISSWAASIAFYTMFALPAVLVLMLQVINLVSDDGRIAGFFLKEVEHLVGQEGGEYVRFILEGSQRRFSAGILAGGFAGLFLGATGVFLQLQTALNAIFEAPKKQTPFIVNFIQKRLLSFSLILSMVFILLATLGLNVFFASLADLSRGQIPNALIVVSVLQSTISFFLILFLFTCIYKFLPDTRIGWKESFFGGLIAAVGFAVGKYFIGLYIGNNQTLSVYGAARSAFVLLLWTYYAGQIILTGALCARLLQDRDGEIPWPQRIEGFLGKYLKKSAK